MYCLHYEILNSYMSLTNTLGQVKYVRIIEEKGEVCLSMIVSSLCPALIVIV